MKTQSRQMLLIGLMLAMMLAVSVWAVLHMLGQKRSARYAAEDLARCQLLAAQIESLRGRAALASEQGDSLLQEQTLAEQINAAATRASLAGQWQQGIEHKTAVRIEDTAYLRKPAVLLTRGLTMDQLTQLLHHLTYDSPYTAEQIQLRTPPGEDASDRWDADITLTYLIYSPMPAQGSSRSSTP